MTKNYYIPQSDEIIGNTEEDATRLLEKCYTKSKLLLLQNNLHPDFFDLSTGVAGIILQKLANYHIQTAIVVDITTIKSEYFKQLITEANTKSEYRFFNTKKEAETWLNQV